VIDSHKPTKLDHTGDIHYFNKAAALQAISAANQSFNCGTEHRFRQYSMCHQLRRTDDRLRQQRANFIC
jgi:hypothetical protein